MTDKFELSRRKALLGLGTIGLAGAGAGVGTSALFSDEESFTNNSIQAGELDLFVDYVTTVTQDGVSTGSTANNGTIDGGESGQYQISDLKPGDSGFLAFCPKIVDNNGWLFVGSAGGVTDYENGRTEPEEDADSTGGGNLDNDENDGMGAGELSEAIQVDVEYCEVASGVTDPSGPEDFSTLDDLNNPADYTLADLFKELESGFLLDGDADPSNGTTEYPSSPDSSTQNGPCLCISWELPIEVGNEVQSDAVEFDITFAARQRRNNPDPENPFADATVYPGDEIQSAISSASDGDVISVFGGSFGDGSNYTSGIDIQKPLTLARASAERPKIVGGVFVDDTTGVVVDGFEVEREVGEAEGVFQLGAASGGPGPNDVAVADMTICNNIITAIPVDSAAMGAVYAEDVDGLEVSNNLLTQDGGNSNPVRAFMQGRLSTEDLIYDGNTIETGLGIILDGNDKGGFTYQVDATITNNEFVENLISVLAFSSDAEADINNNLFNGTTGAYVQNRDGAQLPLSDILNNNNNTFSPVGTIDSTADGSIVPQ